LLSAKEKGRGPKTTPHDAEFHASACGRESAPDPQGRETTRAGFPARKRNHYVALNRISLIASELTSAPPTRFVA
jgi:hypothetical protein